MAEDMTFSHNTNHELHFWAIHAKVKLGFENLSNKISGMTTSDSYSQPIRPQ
jgi:hypothetical protein